MLCLRQNPFVHLHTVFVYYHQRLKLPRYVGKYANMMGHSKMDSEVIVQVGLLAPPKKDYTSTVLKLEAWNLSGQDRSYCEGPLSRID